MVNDVDNDDNDDDDMKQPESKIHLQNVQRKICNNIVMFNIPN